MGLMQQLRALYQQLMGQQDGAPLDGAQATLTSGITSVIGNYRDNNEDRVWADNKVGLFVVADGMGGQAAGEQASQLAVDIVPAEIQRRAAEVNDAQQVAEAVRLAVLAANEAIVKHGEADPSTQNMGTTIVLGYCRANKMFIAHIGDSRAYLIRAGKVHRLTVDHNLAQALYEANTITAEELESHKFRHVLWKYLGSKEVKDGPDIHILDLAPGDRFLFASDGLTGSVADAAIAELIEAEANPQNSSQRLVKLALDNGSRDNVSCIVLHVHDVPGVPASTLPPDPEGIEDTAETIPSKPAE